MTTQTHVSSSDTAQGSDEGQCVVFRLNEEEFGVKINNVKEIVRLPDITPIPRSPEYVSGICNLRGNVLPVIDTRIRFSMEQHDTTDQTRLLVVETQGIQTGMVVDSVREVMRIKHSLVESPPAVCKGVDKEFLNGVVKVNEGKRLIMMLDLNEVVAVRIDTTHSNQNISSSTAKTDTQQQENSEEEQLVSFKVGEDEYAFDIVKVSEILKVMEITSVPNAPNYVLGLFTIRNHLLPILDMRRLLGLPSLISERHDMLNKAIENEKLWFSNIKNAIEAGSKFTGKLNSKETVFGKWLEAYNTSSVEVETIVKRLKRERNDLYIAGDKAVFLYKSDEKQAFLFITETLEPLLNVVIGTISEIKDLMAEHIQEDQRAMVVESGPMTIGYLVDWVDEVLRIPKSIIDQAPAMATSKRKELKSVAKLNNGERLIMIMDESALVSDKTVEILSDIQSKSGVNSRVSDEKDQSLAQRSLDEEQLVTFTINNEEYGIRIMQVQEINRVTEITNIPRAPYFIDGMTNLRGNVIPVINIRKLFELEDIEVDDRTRIIIVDIGGSKTGLRVDQVNEVLRLSKQDIDETPPIVTEQGTSKLMQGICKINGGKRMIMMLDVTEILDKKELQTLKKMTQGNETEDKTIIKKENTKKLEIAE